MQVPGTRSVVADEQAAGVGQGDQALLIEVEAADVVGGSVAVLHRAQQSKPGVSVALELADDIDQVLQHPRTGNIAVLGDVTNQDGGHLRRLAASIIEAETSPIWVTPPGAPSNSAEESVCTESMMVS